MDSQPESFTSDDTNRRLNATMIEPDAHVRLPRWAAWSAGYVLVVVFLEFAGSAWGDSPSTSYPGFLVPIVWPTALRVVIFLGAAAAAVAYQVGLHRSGGRTKPVIAGLTALMFTVFAIGIATSQQWAAWH